MKKKISGYLPIDFVFVLQSLHRRSLAEIVITGKTRAAGQMWILRPHAVIPFHIRVGRLEPSAVVLPGRFLCLMDCHDHRTEKWRLGARQIVSAIGIENGESLTLAPLL